MTLIATKSGWAPDPNIPGTDRRYYKGQTIPSVIEGEGKDAKERPLWGLPAGSYTLADDGYVERR